MSLLNIVEGILNKKNEINCQNNDFSENYRRYFKQKE